MVAMNGERACAAHLNRDRETSEGKERAVSRTSAEDQYTRSSKQHNQTLKLKFPLNFVNKGLRRQVAHVNAVKAYRGCGGIEPLVLSLCIALDMVKYYISSVYSEETSPDSLRIGGLVALKMFEIAGMNVNCHFDCRALLWSCV
jgi:hypothetical protein